MSSGVKLRCSRLWPFDGIRGRMVGVHFPQIFTCCEEYVYLRGSTAKLSLHAVRTGDIAFRHRTSTEEGTPDTMLKPQEPG